VPSSTIVEALDVALVQQNLSNALLHVGGGNIDGLVLCAVPALRMRVSISATGSVICIKYFLLF
jgi:hypothetical protein